jgi:hypothetical protein
MGFTHTKPFIKQNSCQRRSLQSWVNLNKNSAKIVARNEIMP